MYALWAFAVEPFGNYPYLFGDTFVTGEALQPLTSEDAVTVKAPSACAQSFLYLLACTMPPTALSSTTRTAWQLHAGIEGRSAHICSCNATH
jgi:hypothetical protein